MVVGADGLIGRALADHLVRAGQAVIETTRRSDTISAKRVYLDLSEDVSHWRPPCPVSVAYLCAANASLEHCRRYPAQSAEVNVRNTLLLAKILAADGTFITFPSTSLVYDGSIPFRKDDDPVCPDIEYGRQKAEAERQISQLGDSVAVVRLAKVLGPNFTLFSKWAEAMRSGETIHPFADMYLSPIPLSCAVTVFRLVSELRLPGIFQLSGNRDVSYAEAAYLGASLLGADPSLVQPTEAYKSGLYLESLPAHTTLNMDRIKSTLAVEPPDVMWTIRKAFTEPQALAAQFPPEQCAE